MGRATNKQRRAESQQTARERAAAMRIEQQRRERRRRMTVIGGVTLGLLAIVGAIIGISLGSGGGSSNGGGSSLTSSESQGLHVSDASFNTVGAASGAVQGLPQKTPPGTPPLTSNGKPEVLYIGAEFCPYCAADRWGLAVALNRFGDLSGLKTMKSSSTDVYPNTPTLTFVDQKYSSKYFTLKSVENEDRAGKSLQSVDSADKKLWTKYTYNCQNGQCGDGFPLIDLGGKAVVIGPMYNPDVLKGLTQQKIIQDLSDPSSPVAKAILGSANYMTAAMCSALQNPPSNVCTPQITKLADSFPTWKPSSSTGSSANSSSSSSANSSSSSSG